MNAVKGVYRADDGQFTIKDEPDLAMARDLLHGQAYHEAKSRIMRPIDEFFSLLERRSGQELNRVRERTRAIILSIIVLIATMGLLAPGMWLLIRAFGERLPVGPQTVSVQVPAWRQV